MAKHILPRWYTFEPGIAAEQNSRAELESQIASWWDTFEQRAGDICALFKKEQKWDLASWMSDNLQAIDPRLMWEFGPGLESGHRLVITPENRFDLIPLAKEIVKRSPELNGWSFFHHRLRETYEEVLQTITGRTGAEFGATGFKANRGELNRIDLVFEFPKKFLRMNGDLAFSQAFVATESFLGEDFLNDWIGLIVTKPKSWGSKSIKSLGREADRLKSMIIDSLPEVPYFRMPDNSPWSLFELKPDQAADYPEQLDIFVGKSMSKELWRNAHTDASFHSERYSKHGELFCYLKMDGSEGLDGEVFEDKGDIENALDEALRPKNLGCCMGGGTGLRYSYIDLAIVDLNAAIPVIREALQKGRLNRRSWIQFFDTEWQHEWIGVWEDSPEPPRSSVN